MEDVFVIVEIIPDIVGYRNVSFKAHRTRIESRLVQVADDAASIEVVFADSLLTTD